MFDKIVTCFPLKHDKMRVCVYTCACACISAYDETPRKELEAMLADAGEEERCLHNVF